MKYVLRYTSKKDNGTSRYAVIYIYILTVIFVFSLFNVTIHNILKEIVI